MQFIFTDVDSLFKKSPNYFLSKKLLDKHNICISVWSLPDGENRFLMYQQICNFQNLLLAYQKAQVSNRYKISALKYSFNLESNLIALHQKLITKKYFPKPYKQFLVVIPKLRQICAPEFEDRIVQHALVSQIEPIFEKIFIYDSYACRQNKGTHFALKRLKKFLKANHSRYPNQEIYILKCDIKKYFQSISWDILLKIVSKKIPDLQTFQLIKKFVVNFSVLGQSKSNSAVQTSLFDQPENLPISVANRCGLPIGNLTSQLLANVYLNQLDYFVKHHLHQKYYGRYMDDFFIISQNKEHLKELKKQISIFLKNELRLTLHPNKSFIANTKNGVCFVGYRIFYDHILIRGSTLLNFQKKYSKKVKQFHKNLITQKDLERCQSSFLGHLKHANAYNLGKKMFIK